MSCSFNRNEVGGLDMKFGHDELRYASSTLWRGEFDAHERGIFKALCMRLDLRLHTEGKGSGRFSDEDGASS